MIQIPEMIMSLYVWLKNWLFDNTSYNGKSTNCTKSKNKQGENTPKQSMRTIRTFNERNINAKCHGDIIGMPQEEYLSMNKRMDNIELKFSTLVLEMEKIANGITLLQDSK